MICLYINSYLAKQSINVFYFLNLGISLYFDFDTVIFFHWRSIQPKYSHYHGAPSMFIVGSTMIDSSNDRFFNVDCATIRTNIEEY